MLCKTIQSELKSFRAAGFNHQLFRSLNIITKQLLYFPGLFLQRCIYSVKYRQIGVWPGKKFGMTEWIRYAPDYKEEDLIPIGAIQRESSPLELFTHLLSYEEKLRNVYTELLKS